VEKGAAIHKVKKKIFRTCQRLTVDPSSFRFSRKSINATFLVSRLSLAPRKEIATISSVSASPHSPRQLFSMLDSGRLSLDEFRAAMKLHALEIIDEMEEDHLNPVAALLEQMTSRRAASKLLKTHTESLIREVLQAFAEIEDFFPGRWLWNATHPHIPLHAFFRSKRTPVFRILEMEARPQLITTTVEYGTKEPQTLKREQIRLRRDRRGQLELERRQFI